MLVNGQGGHLGVGQGKKISMVNGQLLSTRVPQNTYPVGYEHCQWTAVLQRVHAVLQLQCTDVLVLASFFLPFSIKPDSGRDNC